METGNGATNLPGVGSKTAIIFPPLQMLSFIRDTYGKRNLGKKTLVDDRFLI